MEIYLNELSAKSAIDNQEAKQWISQLLLVTKLLRKILNSLEHTLTIRTTDDFTTFQITPQHNLTEFLQKQYSSSDPELIILLKILDTPHISSNDPKRSEYEYSNISLAEYQKKSISGLVAAHIKKTMSISFDNSETWDTCIIDCEIEFLNNEGNLTTENAKIKHLSKKEHLIKCHLGYLTSFFDWKKYKPSFDVTLKEQNLLPLIEIYSLHLGVAEDVWETFYKEISVLSEGERIVKIREIAQIIADLQGWEDATGSPKTQNQHRILYCIPNSDFIMSVDTQHGDFEVLKNHNKPNHYGSISFDGKRFKNADNSHSIKI
jgi:hypothetical protein